MTKKTIIKWYRRKSAADGYILGYVYAGQLWMIEVKEIMPRFLTIEEASRNQGENLRLRIRKSLKEELMRKNSICLGNASLLVTEKYNKGEIFEKLVTEYFGQTWKKDTIPFWIQGDINVNGRELQIKLDAATLMNTKQIEKFKKWG